MPPILRRRPGRQKFPLPREPVSYGCFHVAETGHLVAERCLREVSDYRRGQWPRLAERK